MSEVVIKKAEAVSTREDNERLLKIVDSVYDKEDLEHASTNATQVNA